MDLSKYRQLYVSETQENLEKISQLLVELETKPNDRRAIDTVFRLVHSIKGMSGTMGYTPVFELAHHLEDLMDRFRRLQVPMHTAAIDVILAGADRIGQWLTDVDAEQLPLRNDVAATTLHRRIQEMLEGRLEAPATPPPTRRLPDTLSPAPLGPPPTPPATDLAVEPGDIVITAEMDPAAPDPGLRGFLLHRKLGDLGRIRAARPDVAELRLGRLDGPVQIVLTSSLDVSQIEGYLSLVPDLLQVHVRREDPPKAVHAADPPEPPTLPPEASPPAFDEPMLLFSEDFGGEEVPVSIAQSESGSGNGFSRPSATPHPAGFSEFDFEDLLGDTIREAPREERPSGVLAPTSAGRTPTLPPFEPPELAAVRHDPTLAPEPDDHPSVAEAAIVRAPRAARSVRVRTDWLDAVLNRTGDLLIIAQRLWNRNQNSPDPVMTEALSELSRVLSALHQDALSVRMTPLSVLTVRLPRAVRDMARRSGKRAVLVTRGDDQHLDRAIIEGLDAPLTHLLSNAVEHGIELPELREAQGKRPGGTIQLVCTRVRDEIVVEVSDDGAGVDREKLANRAVEMGLLSRGRAEQLAERDLGRLMCLPGLTSRDEPGENAGRGVGLDAVREMVTGLGGTLEMQSEAGLGTTIRLRLPRTPGISKLLLVEADAQVFGLPLARVLNTEMFDPAARSEEQGMSLVEHQGSRLRVFPLRHLLGLPRAEASDRPEVPFPGVVCHGDEGQFVLTVDRVVGQQDAVMKPLGPLLERIDGLLGVTIDPVGKPVFIVDVLRFLARRT
jgi:chemotaxis protein histidine kinase CheA